MSSRSSALPDKTDKSNPIETEPKAEPLVSASEARKGRVILGPSPARRWWRAIGITVGVLGCTVSMAVGCVVGLFYWGGRETGDILGQHWGSMLTNTVLHGNPTHDWTPEIQYPGTTALNVLILGCDH